MFAVVSAPAVPEHLRGYIGRFLQQIGPSLYVGKMSPNKADLLWEQLVEHAHTGGLVMVCSKHNDSGFSVRMHNVSGFRIAEFDGIELPVVLGKVH